MTKIVFKCLQCGRCCRNLLKEDKIDGLLYGLALSLEETKLFPKEAASSQIGIGLGYSGPKFVIQYQLNLNVCPHISKNNLCKTHDSRPLACQAFPLISLGPIGTTIAAPEDCTFVAQIERKIGSLNGVPMTPKKFRAPKEWQAISKINKRLMKSFSDHIADARFLWGFDLKSREWQITRAV